MAKQVKTDYINNTDFLNALIEYKENCETSQTKPKIPEYIGECFVKIAENLSKRPNFYAYTFRDEMVLDSIENCIMYCHNFDPSKSKNPFAYFTQIAWFAFLRRIAKEKKQQYIKYKATESFGVLDEAELMELGNGEIKQIEVYDNMYEFINSFEEAELKKKQNIEKAKGIELFLDDVIETVQELSGETDE
jgi:hypothetical protein